MSLKYEPSSEPQYEASACGADADASVASCALLAASCPQGEYRKGCGAGQAGACVECSDTCPDGAFREGCGGTQPGKCSACQVLKPLNPEPRTRVLKPLNPEPRNRNPKHKTRKPKPQTLNHTPQACGAGEFIGGCGGVATPGACEACKVE